MSPKKKRSLGIVPFQPKGPNTSKKKLGPHGKAHKALQKKYKQKMMIKAARSSRKRKKYRVLKPKVITRQEIKDLASKEGYKVYDDREGVSPPGHGLFGIPGPNDMMLSQLEIVDSTDGSPLMVVHWSCTVTNLDANPVKRCLLLQRPVESSAASQSRCGVRRRNG